MIGLAGVLLGVFALGTPLLPGKLAFLVLGLLILIFGLLQNFAGFALRDPDAAGSWFSRGGASIVTGLLLIAMPSLTFAGLALLLGLSWIVSGVSAIVAATRSPRSGRLALVARSTASSASCSVWRSRVQWPISGIVSIGLFVGLRYVSAGWSLLVGSAPQSR